MSYLKQEEPRKPIKLRGSEFLENKFPLGSAFEYLGLTGSVRKVRSVHIMDELTGDPRYIAAMAMLYVPITPPKPAGITVDFNSGGKLVERFFPVEQLYSMGLIEDIEI